MAGQTSLPALLDTLTSSLTSSLEAAPKFSAIETTQNGVSLLDVKNELLMSYLQNLVFMIILKIRNAKRNTSTDSTESESDLTDTVVQKLVELRLYLEKGVRPLEEKLRFQLDKILRAAEDADRIQQADNEAEGAESDLNSDDDDDASDGEEDAAEDRTGKTESNALRFAPSLNTFSKPSAPVGMAAAAENKTGVYKPPKITPTVMPTAERRDRRDRRPMKSATMEEYISNELDSAPRAMPSVGTNVSAMGRTHKTTAQRDEEARRREYEETNFVRLPKESKKDRMKRNKTEGRSNKMSFGGEDWRDLGEGVDRIDRLTRQKKSGGTKALLEKSRKRGRDTIDSGRGSGFSEGTREIGERFNKKLKVHEGGRRDRGKR
ncbi:hypothetical protein F5Y15DRAFT_289646 [Xylariaceae sp. FL0016]|nr:hypothetical protein F5Y15DRAFT_289646 [Xylariaceae sp. FL0016]